MDSKKGERLRGSSFARRRFSHNAVNKRRNTLVMSTPSSENQPWEALLEPGVYTLADVIAYPDFAKPIPRHARLRVDRCAWHSSTNCQESNGKLELSEKNIKKTIPVVTATSVLLEFYGCAIINSQSSMEVSLTDRHVIQDFTYTSAYFEKYVSKIGTGLETLTFAHIDCPFNNLDGQSGLFIIGKWDVVNGLDYLCLTAFRIPERHALYVPAGVIHSNDYLQGWQKIPLTVST
eukprot:79339_1